MSKIMPLENLSSIKGAKVSEIVEELFGKVRNAIHKIDEGNRILVPEKIIDMEMLRDDIVINTSEDEIKIIRQNFPVQKEGYLVVPRVIEE
jgi:Asp-tRNA(Asn)/Glu-tRNA(Gln) amidotransferase C subunit